MSGLEQLLARPPDLVLLDLGLPDVDGLALIAMIRAASRGADHRDHRPRRRPDDRAGPRRGRGRLRHQAVRHRAARRPDPRGAAPRSGLGRRRASRSGSATWSSTSAPAPRPSTGRPLELARKEFDLLLALASRAGEVVTKRELLADVWQQAYGGSERSVDVHLSWLRRKLGETAAEPRYLHVVRGVGDPPGRPGRRTR